MQSSSKIVRFGFALLAILLITGLIYAGAETPESELAAIVAHLSGAAG